MTSGYYTTTQSETFTVSDALHISAKVAADLKRMQRFYGSPHDEDIDAYEKEATVLLHDDYLDTVTYGFRRGENWIVALHYAARQGGVVIDDDSPGKIPVGTPIGADCSFYSFLRYNRRWGELSREQKTSYRNENIGFLRSHDKEPYGAWSYDKAYSAGGRGVLRGVVG